ncbi:hypothetical protein B0H13DRAFT_1850085 [Mycena leptocephala]|nr:hypothetical protein B0H13DRAFT_1850085 [Mycena leptocephala]
MARIRRTHRQRSADERKRQPGIRRTHRRGSADARKQKRVMTGASTMVPMCAKDRRETGGAVEHISNGADAREGQQRRTRRATHSGPKFRSAKTDTTVKGTDAMAPNTMVPSTEARKTAEEAQSNTSATVPMRARDRHTGHGNRHNGPKYQSARTDTTATVLKCKDRHNGHWDRRNDPEYQSTQWPRVPKCKDRKTGHNGHGDRRNGPEYRSVKTGRQTQRPRGQTQWPRVPKCKDRKTDTTATGENTMARAPKCKDRRNGDSAKARQTDTTATVPKREDRQAQGRGCRGARTATGRLVPKTGRRETGAEAKIQPTDKQRK